MPITIEELGFDRVLVVQDRWCDLLLRNRKSWEMRSTKTKFRGTFGLIAARSGLIHGKAELVDSLDAIPAAEYYNHIDKHKIPRMSGFAEKWKYPWVIRNAIKFNEPVPYCHPQGAVIWVKLTNEMLNAA